MPVTRAMVTIPMDTALPRDVAVNTWHFDIPTMSAGVGDAVNNALKAFYDNISGIYPSAVAQAGWTTKMYDLTAQKPRAPIYEKTWTLAADPTGAELPHELAICLSFQGDRISGVPQARRRGRIYLGPIDAAHLTGALVQGTTITTICNAATAFLGVSDSAAEWSWIVHSVVGFPLTFDALVTNGWVDNAVDIQRRRGIAATARTVWT